MQTYKNTQLGKAIIILVILIQVFLTIIFFMTNNSNQIPLILFLFMTLVFAFVFLLFYKLVVIIDKKYIYLKYGIGIIKIKIPIEKIEHVTIVKNKWYYGLGIRIIPNGMLYNIQGLNAVELHLINSKKVIRIGSNDCTKLKEEIEKMLI